MWFLCKTYQKLPSDDWFDEMNPIEKRWIYESWIADQEEQHKFTRDYVVMSGFFTNPEMAKQLQKIDNPDYSSSDDDFDKSIQMIEEDKRSNKAKVKKRRRRLTKK